MKWVISHSPRNTSRTPHPPMAIAFGGTGSDNTSFPTPSVMIFGELFSWDTALTAQPTSDYSVGMTWGQRDDEWHLLDLVRERMDFPQLRRRVAGWADRWQVDTVLIEHAGSGIPLLQQLRHEDARAWRFYPVIPQLDKATRLEAQTARMETGRYLLPASAPWLPELRRELLAFPAGRYDDQVDCMVQFIEWSASPRGKAIAARNPVTGRPTVINRPRRNRPVRPSANP